MSIDAADLYAMGGGGRSRMADALLPNPYQALLRRQGMLSGAGQNLMQAAATSPAGGTGGMIAKALMGLVGGGMQGLAMRNVSDADKEIQAGIEKAYGQPNMIDALTESESPYVRHYGQQMRMEGMQSAQEQAAKAANAMALISARGDEDRRTEAFKAGMRPPDAGFSLSPGQTRYDPQGNPIVSAPGSQTDAPTVRPVNVGVNAAGDEMMQDMAFNPQSGQFDAPVGQPYQRSARERPERIGELTPKEADTVRQVQKDYGDDPATKGWKITRPLLTAARTAPNDAAGDQQLIKVVEKMLDPNSAVLLGESQAYAAGNLQGLAQRAIGFLTTGQRLPDNLRQSILGTIERINGEVEQLHNQVFDTNRRFLSGIDPKLGGYLQQVEFAQSSAPATAASPAPAPAQSKAPVRWTRDADGNLVRER